jgi:hypothetical protein
MNPWDCLLPSPGQETMKRTSIINEKRKRSKDKTNTKEAKRRHFHVKQTRSSKTASKEIREGKTYESEIGISPMDSCAYKDFLNE